MQRIVLAMTLAALAAILAPALLFAQADGPTTGVDLDRLEPLLPPGISEFNLEIYGKFANTWTQEDGTQVVMVQGAFSARLGHYKLVARDAVVWFKSLPWHDRRYIDAEIFLWQGAEIVQPGGAVESGPALLVTLRTFGKPIINMDSRAAVSGADSPLFEEATQARRLLDAAPAEAAEQTDEPILVAPTLEQLRFSRPRLRKKVDFSAKQLYHEKHGDDSVIIAIEDVFVSQGSAARSGEFLELRADAAVVYLHTDQLGGDIPGLLDESRKAKEDRKIRPRDLDEVPDEATPRDEPKVSNKQKTDRQAAGEWVSAVYLEGDVLLTRGQRMIRASRLYYDFENDKALILDGVTRALEPSRKLPIYIRADVARQLDSKRYVANNAQITTSEFHTPHVSIGASVVNFEDITPRDASGQITGVQAGTYSAKHTTLNMEGMPLAYWPYSAGTFSRDTQAFRSAKFGYNGDFGASVETKWYLFNLLGLEQPEGYDATLKVDYFAARGPAGGIDMDYQRDDYFGLVRSHYIHDDGDDDLGPTRGGPPDTVNRGRFLMRHRQYFPEAKGWELSVEGSYISDDNFLESYERNEWENGKPNENALYLVKRQDNWQFSALANWRISEFLTQTEHLPDTRFTLIGEPLGNHATFYSDNRLGVVRYRPDERRRYFNGDGERRDNLGRTGSALRGDTRQEAQFLIPEIGPLKLTPYLMARGTGWDDTPSYYDGGGRGRGMVGYGIHGNVIASRVYDDVESELFDLHRLRHVVKPDVSAFNMHSTLDSSRISPFDPGVEDIDDFGGVALGLRQRFQTQRGGPGRWRTVDWIKLDIEAGFFHNPQDGENTHGDFIFSRPEDSITSNFIAANFQYRLSDSTVFIYDGVYDTNRGNMGTSNVSVAVEREPRLAYFAGWRYIHDTNNSLLAFGANYRLTQKHTIAFRELYDIELGRNYSTQIIYIRKWPRWYTALSFDVDRALDDIGINLSIWPEGAPTVGLGSKRYTGLADSVGLNLK